MAKGQATNANASAYLYTGPEFGERNDAVEKLRVSMKKNFGNIEEYLFYATETNVSEVVTILQSGSLFSDAKFVLYRAAESIKKKRRRGDFGKMDFVCVRRDLPVGSRF